jgi:hypothetical protein
MYFKNQLASYRSGQVLRAHSIARKANPVGAVVGDMIDDDTFDPALVEWLAHRLRYFHSFRALFKATKIRAGDDSAIQGVLIELNRYRLYRVASVFGVPTAHPAVSADELRAIGTKRARMTIAAALGECDFRRASREEKAAFCLGKLVEARP